MAATKKAKVTKEDPAVQEQVVQFIKDHLIVRLQKNGFSAEKAEQLVSCCEDEEICKHLPKLKMQALGEGGFLKWLKENKEELINGVKTLFELLALIKPFGEASQVDDEEEEIETEEDEEEEEADEETEEEEEEEEEEPAPKKKRR